VPGRSGEFQSGLLNPGGQTRGATRSRTAAKITIQTCELLALQGHTVTVGAAARFRPGHYRRGQGVGWDTGRKRAFGPAGNVVEGALSKVLSRPRRSAKKGSGTGFVAGSTGFVRKTGGAFVEDRVGSDGRSGPSVRLYLAALEGRGRVGAALAVGRPARRPPKSCALAHETVLVSKGTTSGGLLPQRFRWAMHLAVSSRALAERADRRGADGGGGPRRGPLLAHPAPRPTPSKLMFTSRDPNGLVRGAGKLSAGALWGGAKASKGACAGGALLTRAYSGPLGGSRSPGKRRSATDVASCRKALQGPKPSCHAPHRTPALGTPPEELSAD